MITKRVLFVAICSFCIIVMYISTGYFDLRIKSSVILEKFKTEKKSNETVELSHETTESPMNWVAVEHRRLALWATYVDDLYYKSPYPNTVQILAYKHCLENGTLYCSFQNETSWIATSSAWTDFIDARGRNKSCAGDFYGPFYIYCSFPEGSRSVYVSTLPEQRPEHYLPEPEQRRSHLQIQYLSDVRVKNRSNLTLCVSPLFNWSNTYSLILFLEYYLYQKVDHFVFYYRSAAHSVHTLLKHYEQHGVVELIYWPALPLTMNGKENSEGYVSYNGQILTMNDCIQRCKATADFVGFFDVDELLVPSTDMTVLDLVRSVGSPHFGSFMFRSSFVHVNWPSGNSLDIEYGMDVFDFANLTVLKENYVWSATARSKLIVKPIAVEKQSVHVAWSLVPGYTENIISPEYAVLYHLRSKEKPTSPVSEDMLLKKCLLNIFNNGSRLEFFLTSLSWKDER